MSSLTIAYLMNTVVAVGFAFGLSLNFGLWLGLPCGAFAFVVLNRLAKRAFDA